MAKRLLAAGALLLSASTCAAYEECVGGDRGLGEVPCQAGIYDCAYCLPSETERPASGHCAPFTSPHANPEGRLWVVIVSAVVGMAMAFGIGGNDSANSWGTSVGSGAISLRSACLIGGAAEFLGATFLGAGVSSTIQKGVASVVDSECWACGYCDSRMPMYQFGMFGALCGAAFFLLLVTVFGMPVSTTHAIVGGVVGMTATVIGWGCLNWTLTGLTGIILSWVISPLFAGVVGALMYLVTHCVVFRANSPTRAALRTVPILYGLTTSTMVFLILKKSNMTKEAMTDGSRLVVALVLLASVPFVVQFALMGKVREQMCALEEELAESAHSGKGSSGGEGQDESDESSEEELGMSLCAESKAKLQQQVAKKAFQNLLVFNALVESFAHGANDTANATGPFGAIYSTYQNGVYACDGEPTPWYIMSAAGIFVFLGVNLMGYRVIKTMGQELTDVDFHIGYCVEFASGFSVICATFLGMPVSTTHCQVGAVIFVGALASGIESVSWGMFGKIALTWVATLPAAGGISALVVFFRYARIAS